MKKLFILFALVNVLTLDIYAQDVVQEDSLSLFRDDVDGKFDMSNFLMTKAGFLPVPIVLTNPAIGYGGLLAATFFHQSMAESQGFPTVSGIIGGGTDNSSWMTGAFHMRSLLEQRLRYVGFLGYGDFNMRFYGLGYTDYFKNNAHSLYYKSFMMMHNLQGRLGQTNFYAGGQYLLMNSDIKIRPVPAFLEEVFTQESNVSQLSLLLSYDTRNNFFSPTKGIKGEIAWNYSDEWLGATNQYNSLYSYAMGYTPFIFVNGLIGGLRLEYDVAFDGVPFYLQPFVTNRGVALARYQDKQMFEAEAELLYAVAPRWDLVGFFGLGDAFGTNDNTFMAEDLAVSGGGGFRYLIARKFGIKMGADFSYNEEFSFQIVMGSAWTRN